MKPVKLHIKWRTFLWAMALVCFVVRANAQKPEIQENDIKYLFEQATLLKNENRLELALEILEKVSKLAEKQEDLKSLIDCYHRFALVYIDLDKEESSLFYWDRGATLLQDIAYPYGQAFHKYIEAILLFREGKNFQAIYMLNEAKNLSNDRNLLNNITLMEAAIYLQIEKYDGASKNYNALVVNSDPFEKDYLALQAYLGLAQLNMKIEKYGESVKYASNALEIGKTKNFYKEFLQAGELLSEAYEKLGLSEPALATLKDVTKVKDSIFTIEKIKAEAKTSDRIQFDFMGSEIKRQDEKIEKLSASANRSEITAILTSAFLIVISILAVSLYRNNQIKLKTNDLLQTKNNELQAARDAAVLAMEAKTNFLSTVSHELRTPLYAVTGLTHLLLEENPSKEQLEHLKSLKFSGDYLLNFINDILQINKIDADKLEMLHVEVNLKKTINDVIGSLQQSAKENSTKIVLDYDNDIPHLLMSDPVKISQILMNLIGNAIKFTKNGEVKISVRLLKKEEEDIKLYFEVKDTGIGISENRQQSIFDSFEQGSIQINREYGGTGLGLTIVKSLLGLFGSKIQLESEYGKGSSFFFELDLKSKDGLLDDINFELSSREYELKGLHLLLVEDNKINQVITKKMLQKKEISCDIAGNGTEAVALARTNRYDCILMDIHMPGISGEEATRQIREFDVEIPIIALTAISLDDSVESFYAAGCNDVVTKPFKPDIFYQKIGENIFEPKIKKTIG